MYCRKCGHEMQNDSNFCPGCGTAITETPHPAVQESNIPALGIDVPRGATFVFFGALFFFAIPIIACTSRKKTYVKTEYRFYNTRLDYYEGFFTTEEKTIDYRNITEVNLVRGVIQKKYGLGTIVLSTPATGFVSGRARSGIRIQDIPHAEQVYQQVKGLIQRATIARVA